MKREIVLERYGAWYTGFEVADFEKFNAQHIRDEEFYISALEFYIGEKSHSVDPIEAIKFDTVEEAVEVFNTKDSDFDVRYGKIDIDGWRVVEYIEEENGLITTNVIVEHEWIGDNNPWHILANENSEDNNYKKIDDMEWYDDEYEQLLADYKEANGVEEDDIDELAKWTKQVNYFKFKFD